MILENGGRSRKLGDTPKGVIYHKGKVDIQCEAGPWSAVTETDTHGLSINPP